MILGILQTRVSSSRLPGKVLKPILGRPMLQLQIERLQAAQGIGRLVVATSNQAEDAPLAALSRHVGIECFRGSLNDVLDRFYQCAAQHRPDIVVRLTGDCPLIDPKVIDVGIEYFRSYDYDYVSNSLTRTYPDGLDVEIFRFTALEQAWREANLPSEREHVTPYIYKNPDKFMVGQFTHATDCSSFRWTVDEPADFDFVRSVYEALYPKKCLFTMDDILSLLKVHPELARINSGFVSNEGYLKSLAEDEQYLARKDKSR